MLLLGIGHPVLAFSAHRDFVAISHLQKGLIYPLEFAGQPLRKIRNLGPGGKIGIFLGLFQNFGPNLDQISYLGPVGSTAYIIADTLNS